MSCNQNLKWIDCYYWLVHAAIIDFRVSDAQSVYFSDYCITSLQLAAMIHLP